MRPLKGLKMMRAVSWNCKGATADNRVWDHLLDLTPDLALLQEVGSLSKRVESQYASTFGSIPPITQTGAPQRFRTGILARGTIGDRINLQSKYPWVNAELDRLAGYFVGAEVHLACGAQLKAISVHAPAWVVARSRLVGIDVRPVRLVQSRDVWPADILYAALDYNKPKPSEPWIIAGDFNLCETFDLWKGGPRGNREYLDKIELNLGLVDCLRHTKGVRWPTFRRIQGGEITNQLDYLFVTDILRASLVACDTSSREHVFDGRLSDHLPIVADFASTEALGTP
jgi:endonuclease/exonuclease/phosphatase family metal-dependent hydrolase